MEAKIKMGDREYEGDISSEWEKSNGKITGYDWHFKFTCNRLSPFGTGYDFETREQALADAKAHGITIEE